MAVKNTVTISFKKTKEDKELKDWIYSHSNYSGFIKDLLRAAMNDIGEIKKSDINNDAKLIDLSDF